MCGTTRSNSDFSFDGIRLRFNHSSGHYRLAARNHPADTSEGRASGESHLQIEARSIVRFRLTKARTLK